MRKREFTKAQVSLERVLELLPPGLQNPNTNKLKKSSDPMHEILCGQGAAMQLLLAKAARSKDLCLVSLEHCQKASIAEP